MKILSGAFALMLGLAVLASGCKQEEPTREERMEEIGREMEDVGKEMKEAGEELSREMEESAKNILEQTRAIGEDMQKENQE